MKSLVVTRFVVYDSVQAVAKFVKMNDFPEAYVASTANLEGKNGSRLSCILLYSPNTL